MNPAAHHEDGAVASSPHAQTDHPGTAAAITSGPIAYIDPLRLTRECILELLAKRLPEFRITGFSHIDEAASGWTDGVQPCCVIYNSHSLPATEAQVTRDLCLLRDVVRRVILLSDIDETDNIVGAMRHGLAGYVPASLSLEVVSEAIRLVLADGIFIPASVLASVGSPVPLRPSGTSFTPRQKEVLLHLWEGKVNKIIARELRLSEGTVKVHIKQIMKKVSAHNRTQAVLITKQMFNQGLIPTAEMDPRRARLNDPAAGVPVKLP